jgi:formiminotetrahydrofolate cyclodeaminase
MTIRQFLEAAAAKQPVPGGGSIAALSAALAVSMGEMVVRYSLGKKELAPSQPALESALSELSRARRLLLDLMVEDQAAYETFSALRKLPEASPERQAKYPAALLACVRAPQTIGATALAVLELCDRLVDISNRYLLSDLAVCADLSMASLRCALHNVRVNLPELTDPGERARIEAACAGMLSRGVQLIRQVSPRISMRLEPG